MRFSSLKCIIARMTTAYSRRPPRNTVFLLYAVAAVAAIILVVSLPGCIIPMGNLTPNDDRHFETESPGRERSFFMLEDFEDETEWAVDSAEDHAELLPEEKNITHGKRALKIKYWAWGRYKAQIRKETDYDFNRVTHLKIDIFNPSEDPEVSFGFAFRTRHANRFFETLPIKLEKGWNYGIVVPLNKKAFKKTYGADTYRFWREAKWRVTRIMVQFFEGNDPQNEVIVDNLRTNLPKEKMVLGTVPEIFSVRQNTMSLGQYEKFDVTVRGRASYTDPFNPEDINVWMRVITPRGSHLRINGFVYEFEEDLDDILPVWKVRFMPTETGRHRYEVFLRNRSGESVERDRTFDVFPSRLKGPIRVSPKHPRYFEHTTGQFFYPFGQNVCWASDYEFYFRKIRDYGGNFVRIWMCPWNLQLEPEKGLGRFDLEVGRELDSILDLAAYYGIYVQLVFEYHGMLNETWDKSPYNVENGGMCRVPEDFFRHGDAKRLFRRKIEYIINRWGYSPNIMAWELFNEVEISKFGHENDVYLWHKEMTEYIEQIDLYNHMITTSVAAKDRMEKLWALPHIDFTQAHFYNPRIFDVVEQNYIAKTKFSKPYFVGEFGRGWRAGDDKVDKEGRLLHQALWSQFMTESAGNAMPWWWDTYIEPYKLYNIFGALAKYAKGLDRRSQSLRPVKLHVQLGKDHFIKIIGLQDRSSVYLWFYNPELVLHPEMSRQGNLLTREVTVFFKGMMDGRYNVEYWDPYKGTVFKKQELTANNGEFSIPFHKTDWDYAVKLTHKNMRPPEIGFVVEEGPEEAPPTTVIGETPEEEEKQKEE